MIIHVWKILHGHAPNDIGMEFQQQHRRGVKAIVPLFRNAAQKSVSTVYDNSFGVKAARLWNILPQDVNKQTDGIATFYPPTFYPPTFYPPTFYPPTFYPPTFYPLHLQ